MRSLTRANIFAALMMLMISSAVRADFVNIVDPLGAGEIDEEIGNLTQAAFEALTPLVNDLENGTAPSGPNAAFTIGGASVTGVWDTTNVNSNFSGGRQSFTDATGTGTGTWSSTGAFDPGTGAVDYVEFNFAAPSGSFNAVGLGWIGRGGRPADPTIVATVTFGNGTTLSDMLKIDGTGDAMVDEGAGLVARGKDVFIGFSDPTGTGISKLTVQSDLRNFNGWDDIGLAGSGVQLPQLTLRVNKGDGSMAIVNDTSATYNIDYYTISSPTGRLNPAGWLSLSDQQMDIVDGGDGPGESWDQSGGSDANVLTEAFLRGDSELLPGEVLTLGQAFNGLTNGDLDFKVHDDQFGTALIGGKVEYVTGSSFSADFNLSGAVRGADLTAWKIAAGAHAGADADGDGDSDGADFLAWQRQLGSGTGATVAPVPEPAALTLFGGVLLAAVATRPTARRGRTRPRPVAR